MILFHANLITIENCKMNLRILIIASVCFAALSSAAQYRLPASHSRQHEKLLAHQRPVSSVIKNETKKRVLDEIREREAFQDNEVFSVRWDSPSVNAYAGLAIPETKRIDVTGFVSPLKRCHISSSFGYRPQFGRIHKGTDITLAIGDTVSSAFDGKVRLVKYEAKGYGHYVVVRHDNGLETVYGHLSRALVRPNQRVRAGQPIALGGNTGRSTGPHLHFETRYMGLAINPETMIDFEHQVPHRDYFTFSKSSVEKTLNSGARKASLAKAGKKSSRKATRKARSSKKRSRR